MTRPHTCHIPYCNVSTLPKYLMCARHWCMVPKRLQQRVYTHYQPGQENGDHRPTEAWHQAADEVIEAVVQLESEL